MGIFSEIKKGLSSFLIEERGDVTTQSILCVGALLAGAAVVSAAHASSAQMSYSSPETELGAHVSAHSSGTTPPHSDSVIPDDPGHGSYVHGNVGLDGGIGHVDADYNGGHVDTTLDYGGTTHFNDAVHDEGSYSCTGGCSAWAVCSGSIGGCTGSAGACTSDSCSVSYD